MAIVLKDRVKQSASAPGTGTITLGAIAAGFQAFSAIGNGNVTYFAIVDPISGAWEVNYGTYSTSGTTLTRNATPLSSSNAGALVNFTGTTLEVFCTYPSSKAIYEETGGNVLVDGGPITVIGSGVTTYSTFAAALGEMYANINSFAQFYAQNLNNGSSASTDIVAYNDLGDGSTNFIDMGISSSNYTDATYPIFTPGSGYVYNDGGELIIGSATDDVLLFAGGVATTDWAARIDKTTKALTTKADVNVGGALDVTGAADITGAATFGSTVTLSANPSLALQAATKQYVDNQVTAGLHIHEPVRVETTGNLTATYARAGATNINITGIANGTDVTFFGTVAVNDQVYTGTAINGLLANTAYFIVNVLSPGVAQVSLTFGGAIVTGLTNGSFTQPAVINSGVGATLTNAGAQAAIVLDGITLSVADRVMVRLQTNGAENGVYTVTTVGSGATNWVLTRATDSDRVNPADPNGVGTGDYYFTREGLLNAGDSHVLTTEPNTMIIGYTTLTYTQFSGGVDYVGGTNIDVTGQTISLTGTVAPTNGGTGVNTVTTGDLLYGSGTNTWAKLPAGAGYRSLLMNAGGTNVEWNAVALNQSNAVSGTLGTTNGGTGLNSYTLGDTVYSSAANTLSALAGNTTTTKKFLVQTGTGAASAAPAWDVVNGADVNGNISGSAGSVANALTFGTYLTGGTYNGSAAVTATVDATSANTASKVVARDSSGNFSAGTITATLSGSATSATTATNLAGGAANRIAYQSGAGTTTFATAPSASNQVLSWNGSAFTWSAGTISGVALGSNLNSLTAGTYLTGTAYNGSAAQTWAVDATSANTASKVVARDASGNFSAGTITASLSGNATTTSQTNFSNLTIGGSQVLYAGNYNSYAPTLTGTGATGTWNINITGSAGSAGSVDFANLTNKAGGTGTYTTSGDYRAPIFYDSNNTGFYVDPASTSVLAALKITTATGLQIVAPNNAYQRVDTRDDSSASRAHWYGVLADGSTSNFRHAWYDGAAYFNVTAASGAITFSRVGGGGNVTSDESFRAPIFYDSNDTTYFTDPNNISSLYGIAVRGDQNSTDSRNQIFFWGAGDTTTSAIGFKSNGGEFPNPTGNGDGYNTYFTMDTDGRGWVFRRGVGGADFNSANNSGWILNNGVWQANASMRAPIFYDSNDTTFYMDPASTSVVSAIRFTGGTGIQSRSVGTSYSDAACVREAPGGSGNTSSSYMPRLGWHWGGIVASSIGIETGGRIAVFNNPGTSYEAFIASITYGNDSSRAPIFYDSNNTAYYCDPTGLSNLSRVACGYDAGVSNSVSCSDWFRSSGNTGWFNATYSGGVYMVDSTWVRAYNGTSFLSDNIVQGQASVRAPVFYDSNDTGYYLDPNGTSQLSYVLANNWFRPQGGTGVYWQSYSRGIRAADIEFSYGNIGTYDPGLNGWRGYGIWPNNAILMANGSSVGLFNPQYGWMMLMDMVGNVTFGNNVTAYSDLRLKNNVREIDNVIERRNTLALSAIKYERDGRTRIGYGAQTLRDNGCLEFVHEADDALKLATGLGTLSVDYGETTAILAVTSKMMDDRLAALEAKVAQLLGV